MSEAAVTLKAPSSHPAQQAEQPQALRGAAAALGDDDDDMELELEHPEGNFMGRNRFITSLGWLQRAVAMTAACSCSWST